MYKECGITLPLENNLQDKDQSRNVRTDLKVNELEGK